MNCLYVDNSNVWIEGMHVSAVQTGLAPDYLDGPNREDLRLRLEDRLRQAFRVRRWTGIRGGQSGALRFEATRE